MKRLSGLATLVAALAVVLVAQAGAAGPATVSSTYTVGSGGVPGLVLTTGMTVTVTVTATGSVCPFGNGFCVGPDGYAPRDTTTSSYGGFVLPGAPAWGLVGKVGSGPWTQVGSGPTTLSGTGELDFAVNDDLFSDNTGSFTVTVSYSCWPGWGYGDENHTHCGPPGLAGRDAPAAGAEPNGNANGHAEGGPPAEPGANANGKAKGHTK